MTIPGCQRRPTQTFIPFTKADIEQAIPARFASQVCQYPHRLAIKTAQHSLTYADLHREAQRVAQAILAVRGHGAEPIALLFESGAPLIIAMLGVLQAGKIYVALDPAFPLTRLTAMLDDVQAPVIVTETRHLAVATALARHGEYVLNCEALAVGSAAAPLDAGLSPDTLACIVYTSGSTGRPKGVVHSHRTVLHIAAKYTNSIHINADDRLSLLGSCSVLGAIWDIFSALLNGAAVYPFDVNAHGLRPLADWLQGEKITICRTVPTLFRQLTSVLTSTERFVHLRLVKFGGEATTRKDVELFQRHCPPDGFLYINLSSSETGGGIREFFIDRTTPLTRSVVPAGYAVEDMEVFVLDDDGNPVESSGIGEIAVKSRYLAVGYWRQPDLTRAAFVPDPAGSEARIYRTGDLGRLLPDGCLEHLGRKDFQVKVRGYRVETAEIELALLDYGPIKEAAVIVRQDQADEARLVAYIVPTSLPAPPVSDLHDFLRSTLPDYMVPAAFVVLDALPRTPSSKVDRLALPRPGRTRPALAYPYVPPSTPIETELARLWAEVLEVEEVGVHDRFFDLGGHSLLAMQIIARVHAAWHVAVPVRVLLDTPTVADMAVVMARYLASHTESEVLDRLLQEAEALSEDAAWPPALDPAAQHRTIPPGRG